MEAKWDDFGFGTYPVTVIPHYVHVLDDSVEIAMKLWLPWKEKCLENPDEKLCDDELMYDGPLRFPTILEYLPYRKSDWTAFRDHPRHSWFCSHGYVCVRADMRGSGDSTGHYSDEYGLQEQKDCVDIINWLSSRPWSNGKVGMYGKSWGGFNGLQVASLKPKALTTVISLYSTDNRFTDDVHYIGNCVMGSGMLSWSSQMLLWNARPVTPKYCKSNEEFQQRWKDRLENGSKCCWAKTWLDHQTYDDYWKHGSICENYSDVSCPVLIIGGQTDSYINAAFRMAGLLNYQSRAIIGPWTHDWPDVSSAGPTVDFLSICLSWWDYHLKGKEQASQDVLKWPALQIFVRQPFRPLPSLGEFDGTWVDIPKWPDMFKAYRKSGKDDLPCIKTFYINTDSLLSQSPSVDDSPIKFPKPHLFQGLFCGDWISWDGTVATSQSVPNKFSLCWTSKPFREPLVICGFTKAVIELESTFQGKFAIAARLCHLWPDGESTLITYGICNLSDNNKMHPNESCTFVFDLNATTYTIPQHHRICFTLAPSLFPILYPFPRYKDESDLILHPKNCRISVQVLPPDFRKPCERFAKPLPLLPFPTYVIDKPSSSNKVEFELNSNCVKVTKCIDHGRMYYSTLNLEYHEHCMEIHETNFDLDGCAISILNSVEMKYNGHEGADADKDVVDTKVETRSILTADDNEFRLTNDVRTFLNGENFFHSAWIDNIPRISV